MFFHSFYSRAIELVLQQAEAIPQHEHGNCPFHFMSRMCVRSENRCFLIPMLNLWHGEIPCWAGQDRMFPRGGIQVDRWWVTAKFQRMTLRKYLPPASQVFKSWNVRVGSFPYGWWDYCMSWSCTSNSIRIWLIGMINNRGSDIYRGNLPSKTDPNLPQCTLWKGSRWTEKDILRGRVIM